MVPLYKQAYTTIKPFTEEMDLEKYYDIYDISDSDFTEAMLGYTEDEFEDTESVRVLKILAARFYISRKILLCCLMALDAEGGQSDFLRWSTTSEEIRNVLTATGNSGERLNRILSEEESTLIVTISVRHELPTNLTRLSCTTNTKDASNSQPRAMEGPVAQAELSLFGNPWPSGQTSCAP
jgi:hypothetical protein